ncbi:glycerate kinase [Agriterribacter sp.]|uniref:glycerate kinase type-2 family protein n=1 Tax=Agriterribacter sp. TaxID=2821509 RepID=UPI002B60AE93|nr:glycerate kinase [Agriterribacter sp.]HTN05794.1 glycerate kinase [Agriterribacter sp.]
MSRQDAIQIFLAGVEAVKPMHFIPRHIQLQENRIEIAGQSFLLTGTANLYIAAVGKAASAMALETEKILGNHITAGVVVTKYHHALTLTHCRTIEAGHPVPDDNSLLGAEAIVALFKKAEANDTIILLISGGASALLADAPPGCSLADIQQTVQLLLNCGAAIDEINTVRKHLSLIKGGQLMAYTRARVVALLLSDVPGDDFSVIASGLTVPDATTFKDAWRIIEKYGLSEKLPVSAGNRLHSGIEGTIPETPKPGSPVFSKVYNALVASNQTALEAAVKKAQALGYATTVVSPMLTGDAEMQAEVFINRLKNEKSSLPVCVLWGGETTVTIKGTGKGGRNQQFALAALCTLKNGEWLKNNRVVILSGGTDGTDGPTTAAGAVVDADIFVKMDALSLNPEAYLHDNDAWHFFEKTGGLMITGPTQTNVMDIVTGLIH